MKNALREKINECIENCRSYIREIKKKVSELHEARQSGAVVLSDPLTVKQKALIIQALYRQGIINRFYEVRNGSDNENFELILRDIRKVINEKIESKSTLDSNENSKYNRTIWLSDSAQSQYEFGAKIYQTNNLMVKAVFGISQFWYELFTKGYYGKYVADYYRRNSVDQNYYYLPHNDRRFCLSTSSFLEDNNEIAEFLKRREKHWRHIYTNEIVIPDDRLEKILAFAYLNCNDKKSPVYLWKSEQSKPFSIMLVINLSLENSWLNSEKLEESYSLTTVLKPPLSIALVLAKDNFLCECQDNSDWKEADLNPSSKINDFIIQNVGFSFFSELKKSLQESKISLVNQLRNNCFVNDHNKDNAIERFVIDAIDKIIEQDIDDKIKNTEQCGELIVRLKKCLRKTISNYEYLKESHSKLDEDVLLMDRIKRQLSVWVSKANEKQKQEESVNKRREDSDGQTL